MIKYIILLLTLLSSCVFYTGTSEFFEKKEIVGSPLKLGGYYYYEGTSIHLKIDGYLSIIDSTITEVKNIDPIMLFQDGSAAIFTGYSAVDEYDEVSYHFLNTYENCHLRFQEQIKLYTNNNVDPEVWGVYKIRDDSIRIQYYIKTGASILPQLYEYRGVIQTDSTFTIFEGTWVGSNEIVKKNNLFKFMPLATKLDSTKWEMN